MKTKLESECLALVLAVCILTVCTAQAARAQVAVPRQPLPLAQDSYFFVGGTYVKTAEGRVMDGQMYVHALVPLHVTHRYPVVMIHGAGQTGTNFEGTPDGREGWAQFFVRAGYRVYVVDQPARGRSPYHPSFDGNTAPGDFSTAEGLAKRFTAPEAFDTFPQAKLHTQWPSSDPRKGQPDDPVFDQFYASQVESVPTPTGKPEAEAKAAGAALLDKIGPAILLTHSQGGAFGWQIADARPTLVPAIIAVEPAVTPTYTEGSPPSFGITTNAITFAPALTDASQLVRVPQSAPDSPDDQRCWTQGEPVRTLPNLRGIAIAVVISEASILTGRSQCVATFLNQAGVPAELIRLPNVGIHGNGHMMMLERNSDQIAAFLVGWLQKRNL